MSSALAIASVTAVLKDLLLNGLIDHDVTTAVGDVTVSTLSPDRIDVSNPNQQSQLNLFLYQVTPNSGWRNVGLPARDARGDRIDNPPLGLDLHYLLTAYGAFELHAEILLGYGMQLLHETPILTRPAIRTALDSLQAAGGAGLPVALRALSASQLAEQVEQVKICPLTLNTEEIARMWTAFQAHYRPTAAYQASVVLIESQRPVKRALPALRRQFAVFSLRQPQIERLAARAADGTLSSDASILPGQDLVILGNGLQGEGVAVEVGGIRAAPQLVDVSDKRIVSPLPLGLLAGVQSVRVTLPQLIGDPSVTRGGASSNLAALVLRPHIDAQQVSDAHDDGAGLRTAKITLTVTPPIRDDQTVVLLMNELVGQNASAPHAPHAYSFSAAPRVSSGPNATLGFSSTLVIVVRSVANGPYLLRLQVDGAESPLAVDGTGRFSKPQVSIP